VLFRRHATSLPLPDPIPTDAPLVALEGLLGLLSLQGDRDRRLLVAYLATALLPQIARPILLAIGPMGAGKTTIHRLVKRLLDPAVPESIRLDRDTLLKASGAQVLLLDNTSHLSERQADELCRLVTGEADAKRQLYTDDTLIAIELRRAILLNAVSTPTDRADLLDRVLALELTRIPDRHRRPEGEVWAMLERDHARWLGALAALLRAALALAPELAAAALPRLADWGRYAAAVYAAAGWRDQGETGAALFIRDWQVNVRAQHQVTLDANALALAIDALMVTRDRYVGTPLEMLRLLVIEADALGLDRRGDRTWPRDPRWLWRRLAPILPVLTALGLEITQERSNVRRGIVIERTGRR